MNINNKLVSIVTPCYNGEKFISRFFDSILVQTHPNIELIFFNDGSTDKTEDIVLSYKESFGAKGYTLHYIYQENAGQSAAINQGLKIFKGDYFTWTDFDDFLSPNSIEPRGCFLEQNINYDLVKSKSATVNETNLSKLISTTPKVNLENDLFIKLIKGDIDVTSGSWLVKRTALLTAIPDRCILSPREIGQNYQLLLPLTYRYRCGYIDENLYTCVIRENSHSRAPIPNEAQLKRYTIAKYVLNQIINSIEDIDKVIEWRYIHWLIDSAIQHNDDKLLKDQIRKLKDEKMWNTKDKILLMKKRYPFFRYISKLIHK